MHHQPAIIFVDATPGVAMAIAEAMEQLDSCTVDFARQVAHARARRDLILIPLEQLGVTAPAAWGRA
jgi:hypothetical protein